MIRILTVGLSIALSASAASAQTSATSSPAVVTRSATRTVTGQPRERCACSRRWGRGPSGDSGNSVRHDSGQRARLKARHPARQPSFGFATPAPGGSSARNAPTNRAWSSSAPSIPAAISSSCLVPDDTVLAASQLVNVNAGETVTTPVSFHFGSRHWADFSVTRQRRRSRSLRRRRPPGC